MRAIDLFCGIGGFRIALDNLGYETVFSSEIDAKAQDAYEANFGDRPAGDITQVMAGDVPPHDLLVGGFPCQAFSLAGKRQGFKDSRGLLFFDIVRIADHHKPPMMLLENVPNLLAIDGVVDRILYELKKIGYYVQILVLNAAHYGFRQARKRVFFVCKRQKFLPINIAKRNAHNVLEDILEEDIVPDAADDYTHLFERDDFVWYYPRESLPTQRRRSVMTVAHFGTRAHSQRIMSPLGYAVTFCSSRTVSGLYYIDGYVRELTLLECKRGMGFPDDHIVSEGTRGREQLGNAVIPGMVEIILRHMTDQQQCKADDSQHIGLPLFDNI